jgi:hypothetical protein
MPWSRAELQQLPKRRHQEFVRGIVEYIVAECVALAGKGTTHYMWTPSARRAHQFSVSLSEIALILTEELVGCDISIQIDALHIDWS